MPAYLPGESRDSVDTNPESGNAVIFDLLSGPLNSPLDAQKIDYTTGTPPGWNASTHIPVKTNDSANLSTGGLSTGIGFGSPPIFGAGSADTPKRFADGNFTDNYTPGVTLPSGTDGTDSTLMYIGGGREVAGVVTPYTAGYGIGIAGQGVTRDAGAGPAYTGFKPKLVTATGAVAAGGAGVVEAGFVNVSGVALVSGQSVFGATTTASATPAMVGGGDGDEEEEVDVEEEEEADVEDDEGVLRRVKRKVMRKKKVANKK
jgi:hypothetical protein